MKRYDEAGALPRMIRRTAGTRPMTWLYGHIQEPLDRFVYRCTAGGTRCSSWLSGMEMTMLTTTGAKTGRQRTHVLLGLPDDDRVVVVASNYGREHHPNWYYNLVANPRASIVIGGVSRVVIAHELDGAERERYYERGIDLYPGFSLYRRRAHRRIPVLALDPVTKS